jgi:hypothetical protein
MYDVRGGKKEFSVPSQMMINRNSTAEEWDGFGEKVKVVKKVKELFQYDINMIPDFEYDPSKESTLEIQMKWEDKTYTYSLVFCNTELVMESLLEGQSWIFSRLKDNPDFALNPSYLNEKGVKSYIKYRDTFPANLLFCFKPGEELLKELRNIIVVDEWIELGHREFIRRFESTFSDLSYNGIVNEMINWFGFSEDYEKLDEDNENLIFARNSEIRIPIELTGSGFRRLSRLFPLMVASKRDRLMMIATDPYDYCLHPLVGRALMAWFLKDNPNPPLGKLANIVL